MKFPRMKRPRFGRRSNISRTAGPGGTTTVIHHGREEAPAPMPVPPRQRRPAPVPIMESMPDWLDDDEAPEPEPEFPFPDHLQYARDVVKGRIIASRSVIARCRMTLVEHMRGYVVENLSGLQSRYIWRRESVLQRLRFIAACPYPSGKWRAKKLKIVLQPWQLFFICEVFGWVHEEDHNVRRFHEAILFIARKNGKTAIGSTLGLFEVGWGDESAEVYVCSTKGDQSKILWESASNIVDDMPPGLKHQFRVDSKAITSHKGKMLPLSSKSKTQDGLNPSLILADEAAAVVDANQIHVLQSGVGAREAPLTLFLTTAQPMRDTLFYSKYDAIKRDFNEGRADLATFAMLYELDDKEEVADPDMWIKANPGIGVSPTRRAIGLALQESEKSARERSLTLCKVFNIWSQHETAWIDVDDWNACTGNVLFEGTAYVGFDLAESQDLAAACILWDNGGGRFSADWKFWCPEQALKQYPPDDREILDNARLTGVLETCSGPVVDYDQVLSWLLDVYRSNTVAAIGIDSWHAKRFRAKIEGLGLPVVVIEQTVKNLTDPIKNTEDAVATKNLRHLGHRLLSWMVTNAVAIQMKHGGVQINKPEGEPHRKIDGLDALITATASMANAVAPLAVSDLDLEVDEDDETDEERIEREAEEEEELLYG